MLVERPGAAGSHGWFGIALPSTVGEFGTIPGSCAPWIQVNPSEFDIAPGSEVEVRYTAHVPADTASGTYRAVIFCKTAMGSAACVMGRPMTR